MLRPSWFETRAAKGGSLMRRTPLLGAAALCLFFGAACSGGDDDKSEADVTKALSENLQDNNPDLAKDAADCSAGIVVDEIGLDKLKDVDLTADEPPAELQDEIAAAAIRAAEECDLSSANG
jgi:hypothetical protein